MIITHTSRDKNDNIRYLCNPKTGKRLTILQAIKRIKDGKKLFSQNQKAGIKKPSKIIIHGDRHVRTSPDGTEENNLDNLPTC